MSVTIWYLFLRSVFISIILVFRQPYTVEYSAIFSDEFTQIRRHTTLIH